MEQARVRRWASSQALRLNLKLKEGVEPYTADDFLGITNREDRERERQKGAIEAAKLSRKLRFMKPLKEHEAEPEDIPKWARKDYGKR